MSNAPLQKEWLVTDGRGCFAMGTPEGVRTRKYHGFCLGIAGRSEASFLADLDISIGGQSLWPRRYQGRPASVVDPDPIQLAGMGFRYVSSMSGTGSGTGGPEWEWTIPDPKGVLRFAMRSQRMRGLELQWSWKSAHSSRTSSRTPLELMIRPFFAMRPLHSLGGQTWMIETQDPPKGHRARIRASSEESPLREPLYLFLSGNWEWKEDPHWYRQFLYLEEQERGYPAEEDLYSAGAWKLTLRNGEPARILMSEDAEILSTPQPARRRSTAREARVPVLDFVVHEPAGVVAGFPWFGEWGRDTFVSLPGLAIRWLESGGESYKVSAWVDEVLSRWGQWIQLTGMLPNLIEKDGSHQWESADATLWWCHALASLWAFGAAGKNEFQGLDRRYKPLLDHAIESIRSGRHVFLRTTKDGMLEVTEPHATWMDARVEGCAVTPRKGILPEMNALWFQAQCLQALWSQEEIDLSHLVDLGRRTLDHSCWDSAENDRPNFIFLHSIPLAPSFVLRETAILRRDLARIDEFWTEVGLRSLRPGSHGYQARCVGTQLERDFAYHQGTVWGWLGGHFEMAKERLDERVVREAFYESMRDTFPPGRLEKMPIEGHIAEIFDGEPPFVPRGAPAQAWSLACLEESRARKRLRVDAKLSDILARRWMDKETRRAQRSPRQGAGRAPDRSKEM